MNKEKKEVVKVNQITEGVIWQQILIFFLPILFGTFFQQLYNTADAMIVGHFLGKQALAAVGGTTGTLINLLVGFFVGLSSGATVVISQHYGANKEDKVQWAVHTSIAFSILGGIVLTVVGIGCSRWMLDLMNTPDDVVNHALIYMRVYFLGTIGNLIYNMGSGILRAVGDSKRPLLYLIICCMTNIALDFLFVVGLQMGVMGAALATILSQIISAVLVMGSLMRTRDIYRLHLRKISIDWIMLKRIIRIGFPAGVQSILYSVSNVIIQSAVNSLGTNNVAAWAAYGKVDGLFWMMINALGIAATTFVGQNYGAKKMDRVHRGVRTSMIMAFLMTSRTDPFPGADLLHLYFHRNPFRCTPWCRRCMDSDVYHRNRNLRSTYRVDDGGFAAFPLLKRSGLLLSAVVGDHNDCVLYLLPVLQSAE